jgi:hypothetical protein
MSRQDIIKPVHEYWLVHQLFNLQSLNNIEGNWIDFRPITVRIHFYKIKHLTFSSFRSVGQSVGIIIESSRFRRWYCCLRNSSMPTWCYYLILIEIYVWVKQLQSTESHIPFFYFVDINAILIYFLLEYSRYCCLNCPIHFSHCFLLGLIGKSTHYLIFISIFTL